MATINVPKSQPYLLWNYLHLGKLNDNKKGVVYQRSKKNVFLYKECILYPRCWVWTKLQQKDLFFPCNNKFIEVLNCVQFTAMDSLF